MQILCWQLDTESSLLFLRGVEALPLTNTHIFKPRQQWRPMSETGVDSNTAKNFPNNTQLPQQPSYLRILVCLKFLVMRRHLARKTSDRLLHGRIPVIHHVSRPRFAALYLEVLCILFLLSERRYCKVISSLEKLSRVY